MASSRLFLAGKKLFAAHPVKRKIRPAHEPFALRQFTVAK
jgi:hypothetical protein